MRTPHISRLSAAIALALAVPLSASAYEQGWYVGLESGANWTMNQNFVDQGDGGFTGVGKFKPGWVAGVVSGYAFENRLRLELETDFRRNQLRKLNVDGVGSFGATGYENTISGMANLWYDIKTPTGFFSHVHPYFGGGLGLAQYHLAHETSAATRPIDNSSLEFAYQGGAGIAYEISRHLIASLDWRYLETQKGTFTFDDGADGSVKTRYRSNSLMTSVRYNFGVKQAPVAYVPPPPPPEPVYVPPPPVGPCVDTDGDGVCDAVDKCPGTPKGFKVDADGCIIEQKIILRSVNFEFNKDTLTAPSKNTLDEVAAALVGQPKLRVEIAGHTDSIGSAKYNLNLSKKRAASVKNYLISKGVPAGNLKSEGYGKTQPIATNATEEGRAENRRVEFSVINKPATADVEVKGSSKASKAAAGGDPVGDGKPVKKSTKKKVMKKKSTKVKAATSTTPPPAPGSAAETAKPQ